MLLKTKSLMIVVGLLISSIGCVELNNRQSPYVVTAESVAADLAEAQYRYKREALDLDLYVKNQLFAKESLPGYYLQALEQLQKIDLDSISGFQDFIRLQNIVSNYHSQRLVQGLKSRQKNSLQMQRFVAELSRQESRVAELQSRCFTLMQERQIVQASPLRLPEKRLVTFLFAADSP